MWVRMAKVKVIAVTDGKEPWLQELSTLYLKKISAFCQFELVRVKPYREARDQLDVKKKKEGEQILKVLSDRSFIVLCDERGKNFDSVSFSKTLESQLEQLGSRELVFILGGAYGISDEIQERAQMKMSLSSLVFNHHIAMAVLLEQIYRAFTIIKGIPYHNS